VTSDTRSELVSRIHTAFPELHFVKAVAVTYSEDNDVVVLDGLWVARFPKPETIGRFGAELNLLEALRGQTLVRIPDYEYVDRAGSFGAYRMIAGAEMTPPRFAALKPAVKRNVLADLAGFLSAVHALPMKTIAQADGHIERCWRAEQFASLYRGMRRAKISRLVDVRALERFDTFHSAFEQVVVGKDRLCHNDLSDDHILLADDGYLSGIIDFTDAAWGDPAIDFSYFWKLGEDAVDQVLGLYKFAGEDKELKVRARWSFVRYQINQLYYGSRAKWHQSVEASLAELDPHLKALGI